MLPVAYRELVSASRKGATYWLRSLVTAIAFTFSLSILWVSATPGMGASGKQTFEMVTGLAFAYALMAGFWLTADCISEERREGTLPLLYLTRVGKWEILLSKLAGTSLRGVYGLIALIPVAALPVMVGGVTARDLSQRAVILVLTVLFSLCAGVLGSTLSKGESSPHTITIGLLLLPSAFGLAGVTILFAGVLPIAALRGKSNWRERCPVVLLLLLALAFAGLAIPRLHWMIGSPLHAFSEAGSSAKLEFATHCAFLAFSAIFFFLYAALLLDRQTTTAPAPESAIAKTFRRRGFPAGALPLPWIIRKHSPGPALLLIAGALSFGLSTIRMTGSHPFAFGVFAIVPHILTAFALARHAATPIAAMRSSGFLEVLLSTPVRFDSLVDAQRFVFWRGAGPFVLLLAIAEVAASIGAMYRAGASAGDFWLLMMVLNVVVSVFYFRTLLWLGIYFGFSKQKPGVAAGWATLTALAIPWVITTFASAVLFRALAGGPAWAGYAMSFLFSGVMIAIYAGLTRWSRIKLKGAFRSMTQA